MSLASVVACGTTQLQTRQQDSLQDHGLRHWNSEHSSPIASNAIVIVVAIVVVIVTVIRICEVIVLVMNSTSSSIVAVTAAILIVNMSGSRKCPKP